MADRDRNGDVAFVGFMWLVMAGIALAGLRVLGYWPRSGLAWLVIAVMGPMLTILPYALAENLVERLGIVSDQLWGDRPRRIVDMRRVLLLMITIGFALLGMLGLIWLATGPLAALLRPLGPIAAQHFAAVR